MSVKKQQKLQITCDLTQHSNSYSSIPTKEVRREPVEEAGGLLEVEAPHLPPLLPAPSWLGAVSALAEQGQGERGELSQFD